MRSVSEVRLTEQVTSSEERARVAERMRLVRAERGDRHAAREIVERHRPSMHLLALRLLGDPIEAEDIVQEAFARAFSRLHQFDNRYRLSTWLHRIVLNTCRDYLKSPRRCERLWTRDLEPSRPAEADGNPALGWERKERLRKALAGLRPHYREILLLKDVLELSYREIRQHTGLPIPCLKIRAVRARAQLRVLLGEYA